MVGFTTKDIADRGTKGVLKTDFLLLKINEEVNYFGSNSKQVLKMKPKLQEVNTYKSIKGVFQSIDIYLFDG
ncbi:hypothetical protein GCM10011518_07590 [Flavobacterium limi]|uniref:Uncharacterized protein n=1 Tax=Flavobacterium limi TaxID=2045105 RepID=A0ABQ1TQV5_9FLAO|nr:hypothetical protein GCM10011518_07590 [Flavobacterium limi]